MSGSRTLPAAEIINPRRPSVRLMSTCRRLSGALMRVSRALPAQKCFRITITSPTESGWVKGININT